MKTYKININDLASLLLKAHLSICGLRRKNVKENFSGDTLEAYEETIALEVDTMWQIGNWVLDVIGFPYDSNHEWNSLTKKEINDMRDRNGFSICCRDGMLEMLERTSDDLLEGADSEGQFGRSTPLESMRNLVFSWIELTKGMKKEERDNEST